MQEKQVAETLIRLGFRPHMTGYRYALAGVCMIMQQPDAHLPLTKVIYPSVGERYGVKPNQVERAIRGSIEQLVGNPTEEWVRLTDLYPKSTWPPNGWVLFTLAEMLRLKMMEAG